MIMLILLLSPLSLAAADEKQVDSSLQQLLADVQQKVSKTKTVQCEFEQERNLSLFNQPILFKGKMSLVRPGKLRWENTDPIPSVLIFNDDRGLRCNDDAEPVRFELNNDPIMQMVADQIWTWVDGDYGRLQSRYDVSQVEDYAILLVPLTGEFADVITSITVKFSEQTLQPVIILVQEKEGDSTTIRFNDYRLNEQVSDDLFSSCYP